MVSHRNRTFYLNMRFMHLHVGAEQVSAEVTGPQHSSGAQLGKDAE